MATARWAATTMRALQALLHGAFDDAERLADEALSLDPGRPNVQFTYIDQMALLRWEQGRLGELRDEWQGVVDQFPGAEFARAWLALADAELGHRDEARRELRALAEQLPERPWRLAAGALARSQRLVDALLRPDGQPREQEREDEQDDAHCDDHQDGHVARVPPWPPPQNRLDSLARGEAEAEADQDASPDGRPGGDPAARVAHRRAAAGRVEAPRCGQGDPRRASGRAVRRQDRPPTSTRRWPARTLRSDRPCAR